MHEKYQLVQLYACNTVTVTAAELESCGHSSQCYQLLFIVTRQHSVCQRIWLSFICIYWPPTEPVAGAHGGGGDGADDDDDDDENKDLVDGVNTNGRQIRQKY